MECRWPTVPVCLGPRGFTGHWIFSTESRTVPGKQDSWTLWNQDEFEETDFDTTPHILTHPQKLTVLLSQ